MSKLIGLVVMALSLAGCVAPVGSRISVPEDAATTCSAQCADIGLTMTAVAIMANNVGCVCQPRGASPPATAEGAAAAGGMTTIMMQEQAEQRNQGAP